MTYPSPSLQGGELSEGIVAVQVKEIGKRGLEGRKTLDAVEEQGMRST